MKGFKNRLFSCFKGASSSQQIPESSQNIINTNQSNILQPNDPRYNLDSSSELPVPPWPPYNTLAHYEKLFKLPGHTFLWQEIVAGTENKRQTHFLGEGNFGKVYRCHFRNINEVGAAKILRSNTGQGHVEFMAEINTLNDLNHPNIIRILGKCYQSTHRVIVYEFMPNGSLNFHLFPDAVVPDGLQLQSRGVDWGTRMKIALGVAEALVYLHTAKQMIHRDIKIGNVLLDKDFVPKLTDFGLATPIRLVEGVEKERKITPIMGTSGCIAPETEDAGYVSTKSDVYSYGVLLIQLVTGKKANDVKRPFQHQKIVDWIRPFLGDENINWLVDPALGDGFSIDGVRRILMVARMCLAEESRQRPAMDFVVPFVRAAGNDPI